MIIFVTGAAAIAEAATRCRAGRRGCDRVYPLVFDIRDHAATGVRGFAVNRCAREQRRPGSLTKPTSRIGRLNGATKRAAHATRRATRHGRVQLARPRLGSMTRPIPIPGRGTDGAASLRVPDHRRVLVGTRVRVTDIEPAGRRHGIDAASSRAC